MLISFFWQALALVAQNKKRMQRVRPPSSSPAIIAGTTSEFAASTLLIATRPREMDHLEGIPRKSAAVARELLMVAVTSDM